MTPEEAVRSYVYHPSAEEPPEWPDDFQPDLKWTPNPGRLERRLAVALAFLAVAIFGFILGKSI